MFKKLKEKITEEVKSSPQRFQQLTQSVSDRLQNSSTSDENFFSIAEDDATPSNSSFESGFTNVSLVSPQENKMRRNSNSSIASDVSFLPRYESSANMYHLQSDLDISASEIEDNASNSSQLGHLSKEQIYSAFQKAQMRYHKYRGRYTDLAKHYKDLERENAKMKSVLVETQDKAIRRVTELKEQCTLEQKAKAHLESALRDEIDEKQFKIESLQTKIELLQVQETENPDTLNKYLTDARVEIENLNQRIQEMKANSIIFQTKEQEYKTKIANLEKEIALFSEREKENNLSLAQNKMELHNELLSKDAEISNLKKSLETLTGGNGKFENLQTQNTKLIEKVETLTHKCNNYETELLKMEQLRLENEENSRLKKEIEDMREQLEGVREDAKRSVLSLETKIREKLAKEFGEKEEALRDEFRRKIEEFSSSSSKQTQFNLLEMEEEIGKLRQVNDGILEQLTAKTSKYDDLERNHLELIEESGRLRSQIGSLERELATLQNTNQAANLKLGHLEANARVLERTVEEYKRLEVERDDLLQEKKNFMENLEEERRINERLNLEVEQLKEELEKKNNDLEHSLEEERKVTHKLNSELENVKRHIEEKKKDLELTLDEEKGKLLQKLEESSKTMKHLEETSSALTGELNELKMKNEELAKVAEQRDSLLKKLTGSEETNSLQVLKIQKLEEEMAKKVVSLEEEKRKILEWERRNDDLEHSLEEERNVNLKLHSELEHVKGHIEEKKKDLESILDEERAKLLQNFEESSKTMKHLEETSLALSEELNELKIKNEELAKVAEERDTLLKKLTDSEETNSLQTLKIQNLEEEMAKKLKEYEELWTKNESLEEEKRKIQELEEKNNSLEHSLEEERNVNHKLNTELEHVKRHIEEKKKELELTLDEEKAKLLQKLEESSKNMKHLEETSLALTEELHQLKMRNEELAKVSEERDTLVKKLTDSEEINSLQTLKIQNLEEEMRNLFASLENERKNSIKSGEERESVLRQQLEEKEASLHKLKMLLEDRENDYVRQLDEKESRLKKIHEVEEETSLLKKLLEEANNKEHEMAKVEKELLSKIEFYEADLKTKNEQIETLSKKIEEYNDLIEERNEGFFKILSNFSEPLNNIRRNKDNKHLYNLEQKLQNFEQTFSLERENLAKILIYLKQFEEKHLAISGEKLALEEEKEELLRQITELRKQIAEVNSAQGCVKQFEEEILRLREENVRLMEEQEKFKQHVIELESRNTQVVSDSNFLSEENQGLITEIEELKLKNEEYETKHKNLLSQIEQLESECNQSQVAELERHLTELQHEKQLLLEEIDELKTTPINLNNKSEDYVKEIENLRTKIVQYKSLDLTNRSSIEFYENELQKLKNQNEKLNRKLDETLVTLNHCSELSNSTEIEYLKNVLYNYMLGKESMVLARVIAAVCKFDPQQTELILAKEQQKQTLLGQLGIL